MMKAGHHPASVFAQLRARGVADLDARAYVDQLVALKQQAAAMDPTRLREEAKWMLWQGAPAEQVVERFKSLGIAEEHARPEVERILASLRTMRACDRCRMPMAPEETFLDTSGASVCRRCHARNEIHASERRVFEGALEMVTGSPLIGNALGNMYDTSRPDIAPYCGRCRMATGIHVNALDPPRRASIPPGWTFVCNTCGNGIS